MNQSCFYCEKDEQLNDLMIKIDELQISTFYLNKDQTHLGRSILAFNDHRKEIFELTTDELHRFTEDLSVVATVIQETFHPQKINYAIYGDIVSHLHVHIVPKYVTDESWGEAFVNNPTSKNLLESSEYNQMINNIKRQLRKQEG